MVVTKQWFYERKGEKIGMNNRMEFTQEELQLLYAACMSYGDKLLEIIKSIPNEKLTSCQTDQKIVGTLQGKSQYIWRKSS